MYAAFWLEYLKKGYNLEDRGIECTMILKCMLREWDG
jgi:hypothetical protein